MRRAALALALSAVSGAAAAAESPTVAALLKDSYEIRAAFSDNNGGAYVILQKATEAYMCHSNPSPRCEKLS